MGAFLIGLSFITLLVVKEPKIFDKKQQKVHADHHKNDKGPIYEDPQSEHTLWQKISILTSHVVLQAKANLIIPLAFFANFIIRMNVIIITFLTLWTTSFVGTEYLAD